MSAPEPSGSVSVVVPVYNEAEQLPELVARIAGTLEGRVPHFEILLCDDASDDGSAALIEGLRAREPRLRALRLDHRSGQHAALRAGLRQAGGEVLVTLDADCQVGPEQIPALLELLAAGADVASGRRRRRNAPPWRRLASACANRFFGLLSGLPGRDWGSAFRAYRRPAVAAILERSDPPLVLPDLLALAGLCCRSVDVEESSRERGPSRYHLLSLIRLGWILSTSIVRLRWTLWRARVARKQHPARG